MGRKPTVGLTPKQAITLIAIKNFIKKYKYPPTLIELGDILCISRTSTHHQISQLILKGYIKKKAIIARGIVVTKKRPV